MHLTLLESDRSLFRTAECVLASVVAHAGIISFALGITAGGSQIPTDEREARVFFLLPPDRVVVPSRQTEVFQLGKTGSDFEDGASIAGLGADPRGRAPVDGAGRKGERGGIRGQVPFGPASSLVSDSVFSVLEVDRTVERYDESAAPVYPHDLLAVGAEGLVQAKYVVDTLGQVDTATIEVMESNDPRFSESVRTALGRTAFRPAKRAGKTVRQLVVQRFRFKIVSPSQVADKIS